MNKLVGTLAAAAVATTLANAPALANDRTTVEAFYGLLNTTTAPDLAARAEKIMAPTWESIGDYSGAAKSRTQFIGQLGGFGKLIPNLSWEIEEILNSGNKFIVRGRAKGTPVAAFMGVQPTGKSFDIMTIDIHTVENGLIAKSHHVEDWASAIRQLSAK
ncbi:MAG: ester cyclase [Elstera sp.]